jgi:collagenase-like PrtC family protease
MNWIYIEKDNRKDIMYLTDYGKEIVVLINSLLKTMNMYDADIKQYIEKGKLKKVVKVDIKQLKNEMNE